jgi:iron(II)-dependent oxidoreductase
MVKFKSLNQDIPGFELKEQNSRVFLSSSIPVLLVFLFIATNLNAQAKLIPGEMITIPAGEFIMGNNNGSWEEQPEHSVYLPSYEIGKYEVTRGEYRKFIEAGGYNNRSYWSDSGWIWKEGNTIVYSAMYGNVTTVTRSSKEGKRNEPQYWKAEQKWIGHGYRHSRFTQTDLHPVVGVTYYEAEAYCNWAGGRLPTEAEFEKAARWTGTHSNIWPWGDVHDPEKYNNPMDHNPAGGGFKINQSAPVGSYPLGASPYGCMDMAGNAYEWCADWAKSYPGCSKPYDYTGLYHIVKGGCWDDPETTPTYRGWYLPPNSSGAGLGDSDYIGFRLARTK